jgi:guanylate kinase
LVAVARPFLLNISGPYGVGKDTLLNVLLSRYGRHVHRVSTLTTRASAPDADPSYRSVTDEELTRLTAGGGWLVNAQLDGTVKYATSLTEIEEQARAGKISVHSIFASDAGAGRLRAYFGRGVFSVGVLAAEGDAQRQVEVLGQRLLARGRDDPQAIQNRLRHQVAPIEYVLANPTVPTPDGPMRVFDRTLVNDDLAESVKRIEELFTAVFEIEAARR